MRVKQPLTGASQDSRWNLPRVANDSMDGVSFQSEDVESCWDDVDFSQRGNVVRIPFYLDDTIDHLKASDRKRFYHKWISKSMQEAIRFAKGCVPKKRGTPAAKAVACNKSRSPRQKTRNGD